MQPHATQQDPFGVPDPQLGRSGGPTRDHPYSVPPLRHGGFARCPEWPHHTHSGGLVNNGLKTSQPVEIKRHFGFYSTGSNSSNASGSISGRFVFRVSGRSSGADSGGGAAVSWRPNNSTFHRRYGRRGGLPGSEQFRRRRFRQGHWRRHFDGRSRYLFRRRHNTDKTARHGFPSFQKDRGNYDFITARHDIGIHGGVCVGNRLPVPGDPRIPKRNNGQHFSRPLNVMHIKLRCGFRRQGAFGWRRFRQDGGGGPSLG